MLDSSVNRLTYITGGGKKKFVIYQKRLIIHIKDILNHKIDVLRIVFTILFLMQISKSIKKIVVLIPIYANLLAHIPNIHSIGMINNILECNLYDICGVIELIDMGCFLMENQNENVSMVKLKKEYIVIKNINTNYLRKVTTLIPMTPSLFNMNIGLINQMFTNSVIVIHPEVFRKYMSKPVEDIASTEEKIIQIIKKLKQTQRVQKIIQKSNIEEIAIESNLGLYIESLDCQEVEDEPKI